MPYCLELKIINPEAKQFYVDAIKNFNNNINDPYKDSGFDLFIPHNVDDNKKVKIDHGIASSVYISETNTPSGFYMYPRSSIHKTPYRMCNSVGIIDSGYRGNLIGMLDRINDDEYQFNTGDRIFQICSPDLSPFQSVKIVDHFHNETSRGDGGFGSTGT